MTHRTYSSVPTARKFQSDTSLFFNSRKDDILLTRIDWLLAKLEEAPGKRTVILCDLFLTCNYWIKLFHERHRRILKDRYPYVLALFEAVVEGLCDSLNCKRPMVPQIISEIYGRDMHGHGIQVDHGHEQAKTFSKLERQLYRLRFKGGLAFMYQWWEKKPGSKLVLAESKHAFTPIARKNEQGRMAKASENYGTFVLTMEREIFMAKPYVGQHGARDGIFHSSFTGGDLVTMAGTMLIIEGQIRGIRPDSGHYKPTEMNMALLLQALGMFGVNLRKIQLFSYDGEDRGTGLEFLAARMTWAQFDKQRRDERTHRIDTDDTRDAYGVNKKFPHLQRGPRIPPRPSVNLQPPQILIPSDSPNVSFYN